VFPAGQRNGQIPLLFGDFRPGGEKRGIARSRCEWRKVGALLSCPSIDIEYQLEHPPWLRGTRLSGKIVAFAFAAVLGGCAFPGPSVQAYQATVERIEDRPGDFYTPLSGHEPLVCIYLSVANPSNGGRGEVVQVLVLDVYKPSIHGRVGDRVIFNLSGDLPKNGELEFRSLSGYRVVPRGE
jgi:hypothetical protein